MHRSWTVTNILINNIHSYVDIHSVYREGEKGVKHTWQLLKSTGVLCTIMIIIFFTLEKKLAFHILIYYIKFIIELCVFLSCKLGRRFNSHNLFFSYLLVLVKDKPIYCILRKLFCILNLIYNEFLNIFSVLCGQ